MKNRKVYNLRTHIGGILACTSYDHKMHKAEMELWPIGVMVKTFKGEVKNVLVPFSNVVEAVLAPEEVVVEAGHEEKRGPGRPPGPRVA